MSRFFARCLSGVLLVWGVGLLPAGASAQQFATDRLFQRQHQKTHCLQDVKERVEAERSRSEHTAEHDRFINNSLWFRFRKGVNLGESEQRRFQQIRQGQHRKSPALPQQQLFRQRAAQARQLRQNCG